MVIAGFADAGLVAAGGGGDVTAGIGVVGCGAAAGLTGAAASGTSSQKFQPAGAGGHEGSGTQPSGGTQP